jgi:hypothetical protein
MAEAETVDKPRHRMKKLLKIALIVGLVAYYMQMDPSKKRFFATLLKQAHYLPGRYYA